MTIEDIVRTPEYASLIADYKVQCLWSAGDCMHPQDVSQLNYILRTCWVNRAVDAPLPAPDFKERFDQGI